VRPASNSILVRWVGRARLRCSTQKRSQDVDGPRREIPKRTIRPVASNPNTHSSLHALFPSRPRRAFVISIADVHGGALAPLKSRHSRRLRPSSATTTGAMPSTQPDMPKARRGERVAAERCDPAPAWFGGLVGALDRKRQRDAPTDPKVRDSRRHSTDPNAPIPKARAPKAAEEMAAHRIEHRARRPNPRLCGRAAELGLVLPDCAAMERRKTTTAPRKA
jgi:hypothetical protein